MRVLVLTNMYPPHHYGGYELNCQELVTHLRSRGDEVTVLTSDISVPGVTSEQDEDDVRRELRLYWDDHVVLDPPLVEALRIERHNERALRAAIAHVRPDVVSAWHLGAMSLGLLAEAAAHGLPLVHVINDDWLVYGPTMDRWARVWRRARWLAPLAERALGVRCSPGDLGSRGAFLFISDATRSAAERTGARFPDATVGYCGVNTQEFPVAPVEPRPWGWRLLHVGRIDERKGIDTAIRALALLPEQATLAIYGRGEDTYLAELRRLSDDLRVSERVTFGVATRDELREHYLLADAVLFTPRWAEPFGLVPLEAMACSTPVVATATGGSGEFLLDGVNCVRVAADDHAGVASAVTRLAAEPQLRERLVTGGRATAEELSLERWLALLEAWHRHVAEDAPRPRPRRAIREVLATAAG